MPYIKKEKRPQFDDLIDRLAALLDPNDFEGNLNYIITTLCKRIMPLEHMHYSDFNKIIGVMECAKLEFYRRMVSPYEDEKIKENGDVV